MCWCGRSVELVLYSFNLSKFINSINKWNKKDKEP